jgi:hypothetical protein
MRLNSLTLYRRFFWVSCLGAVFVATAFGVSPGGAGVGGTENPLPTGNIFPTPGGIVFPGFNVAAGTNAAALANGKKGTMFQGAFAPALESGDANSFFGSIATSSSRIGWGIGYTGIQQSGAITHGVFAGVGFKLGSLSLGMGLRDAAISSGFNPEVDFGSTLKIGKDFYAAAVVYDVETVRTVGFGLGFGKAKQDAIEFNVVSPVSGSSDWTVTFAATVYAGIFGTSLRSSYLLASRTFNHTLAGLVSLGDGFNVFVQLTTPRALSFGFTWIF